MDHLAYPGPDPAPDPLPPPPPEFPPAPTPPVARVADPLAVALANASLLGVGYLILGRRRLAPAAVAGTVALCWTVVGVAQVWCEIVVLVWWAALVVHGWFLAGGRSRRTAVRGQRLTALCFALPVLLAVGLLRFDSVSIGSDVSGARESGDCGGVLSAQDGVWFGDRLADAPLTARGDQAVDACHRLQKAGKSLATGLTGDTGALAAGFHTLGSVLADPGNDQTVATVLDGFLHDLPTATPCHLATVTDWLRHRAPSHNALDRSSATATRNAPAALVRCGDDLMADQNWKQAKGRYQQLLDQFPDSTLTTRARGGVKKATLTIELAHVRDLLDGPTDLQPAYCDTPAKYSGAPAYGKGTNRALFYGNDTYTGKLPGGWRTSDPAHATLVVCAGDDKNGTSVQTCPYENKMFPDFPADVTFHKIAIPVKVYELRTGKRVADRTLQISGASCPAVLHYKSYIDNAPPPSDVYVKASKSDVQNAFRPLIVR